MWNKKDLLGSKISVLVTVALRQTLFFRPSLRDLPIFVRLPSFEFLYRIDRNCINDEVDGIKIFISDLKGITLSHFMTQPRSMLCRKLERNFVEEKYGVYDYNRPPNCLRLINTYVFFYINGGKIF